MGFLGSVTSGLAINFISSLVWDQKLKRDEKKKFKIFNYK